MSKNIKTLWDNKEECCDHDEPERGQAFYAGGSEHSGQQILGPSAADSLFERTRQSHALLNEQAPTGTSLPVVFWRNGFTVADETELRDYESPQNRTFLESLRRGETPPELAHRVRGGMIDVKLENKAHLDYQPETRRQAFTGEGHRLGAPVPETVEPQSCSADNSTSMASSSQSNSTRSNLVLDENQPITSIQIRLADSTRLVVRANLTHTIQDIVNHIRQERPQYSEFVLATTFPAKDLSDLSQTIEDAKLNNASVIQKVKR